MTGADKVVCQAATLLLLFALTSTPAKAQFAGFGDGGGYSPDGYGVSMGGIGGGDFMGTLGGGGGDELMGMIPQLMRIAHVGGGRRHRRR